MFVNVSPVDYNADETQNSLAYASRVKMIKNTGSKDVETGEMSSIKALVSDLKERLSKAGVETTQETKEKIISG